MKDPVLISLQQLCRIFDVKPRCVRRWTSEGILVPVVREGRGRSRAMQFNRGEVSGLVYGYCETCGNGYKRTTLKQRFCCDKCRKRYHYRMTARTRGQDSAFDERADRCGSQGLSGEPHTEGVNDVREADRSHGRSRRRRHIHR